MFRRRAASAMEPVSTTSKKLSRYAVSIVFLSFEAILTVFFFAYLCPTMAA
jgi:hypothetical protein